MRPIALAALVVLACSGCAAERDAGVAPAGAEPAAASAPAARAQAFVDSVGTNVHLSYYGSPYDPATFPTLRRLIRASGIRHLRDGMPFGQAAPVSEARALAGDGVRFDYIMAPRASAATVGAWFASVGRSVPDACEGDNEYDVSHPADVPDWSTADIADQATLHAVCGKLGLPAWGPTTGGPAQDVRALGELGATADAAAMHPYFTWRNPGTAGWGDDGYGSLAYDVRIAAPVASGKPLVATETGYSSSPGDASYVPPAIKARYLVRAFLEAFRAGVIRTYSYELADEGGAPYAGMGLVDAKLRPRPAFAAVAATLRMLADTRAPFAPGRLAYAIGGGDASLHSLLLEKRDGTFRLALWDEREEYQGDEHRLEPAAPEAVTVTLGAAPARVTASVLRDDGTYATAPRAAARTIPLSVDGHPTWLEIVPARGRP